MRKIKLYIAISLNGKIAKPDGSVDWLESIPNPKKTDYGYSEFYNTIDTTIQGYNTYNQIINWGIKFPYADKKNYLLTKKQDLKNSEYVDFISKDHIEFIKQLKMQKGKEIWLIGGGQTNTQLFNEKLIDELLLFKMPIILPDGIELFEKFPIETHLILTDTKSYPTGVIKLKNENWPYRINAVNLEAEIDFLTDFLGLSLLQENNGRC